MPRGARIRHRGGTVDVRQTRRWDRADVDAESPIPRTRNAVAAVRGFLWARSDRGRYRVVLEVDGIQHAWVEQLVGDALRHNTIALSGDTVLRLPLLGLRLQPDAFFDQLEQALRSRGWGRAAA